MKELNFLSIEELQRFIKKNSHTVYSADYVEGYSGTASIAMLSPLEWRTTAAQRERWDR